MVYTATFHGSKGLRLCCLTAPDDEEAVKQALQKGGNLVGLYNHQQDSQVDIYQ